MLTTTVRFRVNDAEACYGEGYPVLGSDSAAEVRFGISASRPGFPLFKDPLPAVLWGVDGPAGQVIPPAPLPLTRLVRGGWEGMATRIALVGPGEYQLWAQTDGTPWVVAVVLEAESVAPPQQPATAAG